MEILFYVGFIVLIAGIIFGALKFKVSKTQLNIANTIIDTLDVILKQLGVTPTPELVAVTKYCKVAIDIVQKTEIYVDIEDLAKLCKFEAAKLCLDNGIALTSVQINLVNSIVDIMVSQIETKIKI